MANPQHIERLLEPEAFWVGLWNLYRENHKVKPDFSGANLLDSFAEAGRLDERAKIPLAEVDFSYGDFRDAVLPYSDLESADLQRADFRRVTLHDSDLSNANLFGTNLAGADLRRSNFTGTNLRGSNLEGADLQGANLSDANLRSAHLRNTNLTNADLVNANLIDAEITGAIFARSEPWKAVLYPPESSSGQRCTRTHEPITSTKVLLREIRTLRDSHSESVFYFRGESKCGWELRPSVMRDGFVTSERDMLIDLVSRRPEEFGDRTSALGEWVLAQHHGLRTRFLDVTKNPLVALFHAASHSGTHNHGDKDGRVHVFAVPKTMIKVFSSDVISIVANIAKLSRHDQEVLLGRRVCPCIEDEVDAYRYRDIRKHLYQMIRHEKPSFDERIDQRDLYRVFVVEPQQSSERIRAQAGAFLVSAFHERFEATEIHKWNPGIPVYAHYSLTVPSDSKPSIYDDLRLLNVTGETLFPSLDSSARAITDIYRPEV